MQKLVEKSPTKLRVNNTIFQYCCNLVEAVRILENRRINPWEYYETFIGSYGCKTEKDLEALIQRLAAYRYVRKSPKRKREAGKVLNYRKKI